MEAPECVHKQTLASGTDRATAAEAAVSAAAAPNGFSPSGQQSVGSAAAAAAASCCRHAALSGAVSEGCVVEARQAGERQQQRCQRALPAGCGAVGQVQPRQLAELPQRRYIPQLQAADLQVAQGRHGCQWNQAVAVELAARQQLPLQREAAQAGQAA